MTIAGNELIPDEGYRLTDGAGYYGRVHLGCNDSAERYSEIPEGQVPQDFSEE